MSALARPARIALVAPAMALLAAGALAALPGQSPDWPCAQRLVPELTAGEFWNGPPAPAGVNWRDDPKIAALVAAVAPRDIPVTDGEKKLTTFADALPAPERSRTLAEVFAALVDATNEQRHDVILDLERLDRRQKSIAALVNKVTDEESSPPAPAATVDEARRNEVEQRREFLIRMFRETQQTIRYACQVPSALEARLGAYARVLQGKL